jgi:hypothetical protein
MAFPTIFIIDCMFFMLAIYLFRRLAIAHPNGRLPFPPGPPGLPNIKNLLDWPTDNDCKILSEWGKQYDRIFNEQSAKSWYLTAIHVTWFTQVLAETACLS